MTSFYYYPLQEVISPSLVKSGEEDRPRVLYVKRPYFCVLKLVPFQTI